MSHIQHEQLYNYRRRHRRHRVFFVSALTVAFLSVVGIVTVAFQAFGASILFSLSVLPEGSTEAEAVDSEPSVGVIGSAPVPLLAYVQQPPETSSPPVPQAAEAETPSGSSLTPLEVTLELLDVSGSVVSGGSSSNFSEQETVPVVGTPRPTFRGNVGISNAFIFLEVHSDPASTITASFYADKQGNWQWDCPRDLTLERHTLYLTVFDPAGQTKLTSATMEFIVSDDEALPDNSQRFATKRITLPPSALDQRQALFDVRVNLLGESPSELQPGDQLLAQVNLLNIGSPGYLTDVVVRYEILDSQNKVIFSEQETVAVATQTSFLKVFDTKPSMDVGDYLLEVSLSYDETEAISSAHFIVAGEPVLAVGRTRVNISFLLQFLTLIFGLAALLAYLEYRQVEALQKVIHQVTEEDLRQQGFINS